MSEGRALEALFLSGCNVFPSKNEMTDWHVNPPPCFHACSRLEAARAFAASFMKGEREERLTDCISFHARGSRFSVYLHPWWKIKESRLG